jgi:lipoprotein-anchoring transpeptidase ErfK/SrfK
MPTPFRSPGSAALVLAACALAALAPAAATPAANSFPRRYVLTGSTVAHWAPVIRGAVVRRRPQVSAATVARLPTVTTEATQNVVLVLRGVDVSPRETWYEVRLAIRPNNSTGWVPRSALGNLYAVHTHLYVNRKRFTLTLERDGRTIFRARVGVGRPSSPTPAGEFYIRDELTLHDPFYGPIAFGTSARSAVLTDWPGPGVVGIHGTDAPRLIPGAISHGCIRLVNRDIVRLARLVEIGTPLTVS